MDTLTDYLHLQRRVDELREEIPLREQIKDLRGQLREANSEITKLKNDLLAARKRASKHQRANHQLREKYGVKTVSRCEQARELIRRRESGDLQVTLTHIAERCFLGYSTVKALARDVRNETKRP